MFSQGTHCWGNRQLPSRSYFLWSRLWRDYGDHRDQPSPNCLGKIFIGSWWVHLLGLPLLESTDRQLVAMKDLHLLVSLSRYLIDRNRWMGAAWRLCTEQTPNGPLFCSVPSSIFSGREHIYLSEGVRPWPSCQRPSSDYW